MSLQLVSSREIPVPESEYDVNTHLTVQRGDTLMFHAWGDIWSGVWLTGLNGPNGWNGIDHDRKFPLPGWHPYGLLGKLDNGYFPIGSQHRIDRADDQGTLFLRINDDRPANGSGAFRCLVQVYRDA
ncbi:hypothetical protein ACQP2X_26710 [Actinoplanes sp. CA-131856]